MIPHFNFLLFFPPLRVVADDVGKETVKVSVLRAFVSNAKQWDIISSR